MFCPGFEKIEKSPLDKEEEEEWSDPMRKDGGGGVVPVKAVWSRQ